jgi:hypothetical protein
MDFSKWRPAVDSFPCSDHGTSINNARSFTNSRPTRSTKKINVCRAAGAIDEFSSRSPADIYIFPDSGMLLVRPFTYARQGKTVIWIYNRARLNRAVEDAADWASHAEIWFVFHHNSPRNAPVDERTIVLYRSAMADDGQ